MKDKEISTKRLEEIIAAGAKLARKLPKWKRDYIKYLFNFDKHDADVDS